MTRKCSDHVLKELNGRFTREQADALVAKLKDRFEKEMHASGRRALELHGDLWREASAEEIIATYAERRMRLHALKAKARRAAFYKRYAEDGGDGADALRVLNVGESKQGFARSLSVDAQGRALTVRLWKTLERDLDDAGVLERLANFWAKTDEDFERAIAKELSILRGGKETATGDADAVKAATAIKRVQDDARRLQNNEGAFIGELTGYIGRQSHDALKVGGGFWKGSAIRPELRKQRQAAAFQKWRAAIEPRLDARTFDGVKPKEREAFLDAIFLDIVNGRHDGSVGVDDIEGFRPPASKARSVSARRVLHFKSADDWYAYHREFGQGSLIATIAGDLERAGRNAALMRVWGPSPEAAFKADIERLASEGRGRDASIEKRVRADERRWEFDEVSGASRQPANIRAATVMRWIRLDQVLSKLGGMVLSGFSDVPLAAATLNKAGASLFDSYGAGFAGIARLQGDARKEAADLLGVAARSIIGDVTTRYSATDGAMGVASWAQNFFYRVNGFRFWSDGLRRGVGAMLARHLGMNSAKAFDALDAATAAQLGSYGVEARQWEGVRAQALDLNGEKFITGESVERMSEAEIRDAMELTAKATPEQLASARDELRTRIEAYFIDQAENALTEARARERSRLTFGTRPGTALGEAVRAATQFLSFPWTVMSRHIAPAFKGSAGRSPAATLTHLMVATTLFGYVSMQAKQLAKGLTPRPLTDDDGNIRIDTVTAAFLQGGGLGIYGDFLFGEYNRFGGGQIASLGGPLVGEFEQLLKLFGKLRDNPEDAGGEAIRTGLRNTPFINLFYTRAALDYLFIFQLQEWASPGYLRRYERRIEQERGQEFLVPPSEVVE